MTPTAAAFAVVAADLAILGLSGYAIFLLSVNCIAMPRRNPIRTPRRPEKTPGETHGR